MNKLARVVHEARKNKDEIKANIRLAKNGQFSSVSGCVEDVKVSRDGFPYVVINKGNNSWQNVRLSNILSVNRGGRVYRKNR